MINKDILCYLILTFRMSPLRGRLYSFWGAWQRCNSLEWGALERRTRGSAERGDRAAQGCRDRASLRPHPAAGSHLPAEGTVPPFAVAPFRVVAPCLHPKNRTLHSVQLPDLG